MMEERPERLQQLRRAEGITPSAAFPAQAAAFAIPPNTTATLLLDQTYLTTAYPELTVSGGRDAVIRMRYAESLFVPAPPNGRSEKGNRNEVEGKIFIGNHDEFVARWRRAPRVPSAVVAHLSLPGTRHRDQVRAAHHRRILPRPTPATRS